MKAGGKLVATHKFHKVTHPTNIVRVSMCVSPIVQSWVIQVADKEVTTVGAGIGDGSLRHLVTTSNPGVGPTFRMEDVSGELEFDSSWSPMYQQYFGSADASWCPPLEEWEYLWN